MANFRSNTGLEVEVNREELLCTLIENRDKHRGIFLEAIEGYRKAAMEALENKIEQLKNKKLPALYFNLPQPEDHTDDYNRVIEMFERHVGATIVLSETAFEQYVRDRWDWKEQFIGTTSAYLGSSR